MKYIGLTIGPIWETITQAKRTDALWTSSYIFSYLIEKIIDGIKERFPEVSFLIPGDMERQKGDGGLYPDRIMLKFPGTDDLEQLKEITAGVLEDFATQVYTHMTEKIPDDRVDKQGVRLKKKWKEAGREAPGNYLKNYFKIHALSMEIGENENPVFLINKHLDTLELYNPPTGSREDHEAWLPDFIENVKAAPKEESFLLENKRLRSNIEIAAHRFMSDPSNFSNQNGNTITDRVDYVENLLKKSISANEDTPIDHNMSYLAVVSADGDGMGKVIASLKNDKDYYNFSMALFKAARSWTRAVNDFGGEVIYAGGDDLLFYAPLVSSAGHSIFFLLEQLTLPAFGNIQPTLSFGLSISYHKFPIYEALEGSRELLATSKSREKKNRLTFRLLTHSGKAYEASFYKGMPPEGGKSSFSIFLSLLEEYSLSEEQFFTSLRQKITAHRVLFQAAAEDQEKLKNFFDNMFNEPVHSQSSGGKTQVDFLREVQEFILALEKEGREMKEEKSRLISTLSSSLRIIKFYRGRE